MVYSSIYSGTQKRFGRRKLGINTFFMNAESEKVVPLPTKVESLDGLTIKMAALGSDHSVALTGMK